MEISKYPSEAAVDAAICDNEPLLAIIAFDGKTAYVSHVADAVEHHILLTNTGHNSADIDKFFRIAFDKDIADWTFICPPNYKNISDKQSQMANFYKDGFAAISNFLAEMECFANINIPKRYARHFKVL